jgi:hypothetical protein
MPGPSRFSRAEQLVKPRSHNLSNHRGAPGENRTPDALLRTEALYPLSYGGGRLQATGGVGDTGRVTEQPEPRKRRRAVGPSGAKPAGDEPRPERRDERPDPRDDERFLADVPPHHGPV